MPAPNGSASLGMALDPRTHDAVVEHSTEKPERNGKFVASVHGTPPPMT